MVDTHTPIMLGDALVGYFREEHTHLNEYTRNLPSTISHVYAYRLKAFVKHTMFGIFNDKPWDGLARANGSIVVKKSGELLFFHTTKDHILKDYFFNHIYFDTASLGGHRFGEVYKEQNKAYIKLGLQLRLQI